MSVSVIIPAYKAAETIERALASVAAQTTKPLEAVVVDDGSEDGTFEKALAFREKMNGVDLKVFSQENRGAGAARNRAVEAAAGDWLAFLDADDEWLPEKLTVSMGEIEDKGLSLFAHNYTAVREGRENLVDCRARFEASGEPYAGLYRKGYLATSTVVVSREAVNAACGFDETLATAQDFDLWLKILREGAPFLVGAQALTRYHVTAGSITTHTRRRLDCGLRIARRHAPSGADLRYRILAIHYEAVRAALAQGRWLAALGYLAELPLRLLTSPQSSSKASL